MVPVLVAIGSNVGDPVRQVLHAAEGLSQLLDDFRLSRLRLSAPMYLAEQPDFVNAAGYGTTSLSPMSLLAELKRLEEKMGRLARERNGPREVDLDVIAYGSARYRFSDGSRTVLEIPHPRLAERRFVLEPLLDVVPSGRWATIGDLQTLIDALSGSQLDVVTR